MKEHTRITEETDLEEAISISRTFCLETLLKNFKTTARGLVTLWRSAEEALSECPDPETMPRLLELLIQELKAKGNSSWFSPIEKRLQNTSIPQCEKELATATLVPLVDFESTAAQALGALSEVQPLPPEVVRRCSEKLDHPHYRIASSALRVMVSLPSVQRSEWVPLLLKHFHGRFSEGGNSEGCWIIKCLLPHFTVHREQIVPMLRSALRSDHPFIPDEVLKLLGKLGSAAIELVPDVLEHIGRQNAYTNQEPHLVHIDPEGATAVPGLIELLGNKEPTVRYQAATELEAYGTLAKSALTELTKLAKSNEIEDRPLVVEAAQRAVLAIEVEVVGGSVPERLSQTERLMGLLHQVVSEK